MALSAVLWGVATVSPAGAEEPLPQSDSTYEIVRATGDQVWRLNKKTGEIAVCTLRGDRLICTTSSEAVTPSKKSYEDIEAAEEERVRKEQAQQLALLDRILNLIRDFLAFQMNSDASADTGK
jgi:hypothetical protein